MGYSRGGLRHRPVALLTAATALALAASAPAARGATSPRARRTTRSSTPVRCPTRPMSSGTSRPAAGFDRGISADRAWPLTTGAGVTIADVDVGVAARPPGPGEALGRESRRDRARLSRPRPLDKRRGRRPQRLRGRLARLRLYGRDPNPTSDTQNAHGTNVAGVLGAATNNGIGIAGIAPGARLLPVRTSDDILHQGVRVAEESSTRPTAGRARSA